jgi:hypothetical protein
VQTQARYEINTYHITNGSVHNRKSRRGGGDTKEGNLKKGYDLSLLYILTYQNALPPREEYYELDREELFKWSM